MKGLRKIMKIPPTFIDRTHTNESVFKQVNEEIKKHNKSSKPIVKVTDMIKNRKLKLLGHIIRRDDSDPPSSSHFQ